jgi:hypothetical protein
MSSRRLLIYVIALNLFLTQITFKAKAQFSAACCLLLAACCLLLAAYCYLCWSHWLWSVVVAMLWTIEFPDSGPSSGKFDPVKIL